MESPTDLFNVKGAYGVLGLCLLGIMHTQRVVDDSNKTWPNGNGFGCPYRSHDVFIIVRGRDSEIFKTFFAQIIIGTYCTLVTNTLEIVPIAPVTSDSKVFCRGHKL